LGDAKGGSASAPSIRSAEQLHRNHSQRLQELQTQYEQLQAMFKPPR
jgi:hypothetical protein